MCKFTTIECTQKNKEKNVTMEVLYMVIIKKMENIFHSQGKHNNDFK